VLEADDTNMQKLARPTHESVFYITADVDSLIDYGIGSLPANASPPDWPSLR
jgi:hypothetical protein